MQCVPGHFCRSVYIQIILFPKLSYITNVAAGCGLIRCAGNIVPFENSFPRSTRLYQLMTTKPDEALRGV